MFRIQYGGWNFLTKGSFKENRRSTHVFSTASKAMHVCTSVSTRSDYTNFHLTSLDSAAAALATVCERKTIQKKQKGVTIVWAGGPQSSGKESTYTGRASQIVNTSPPRKTTASLQWVTKSYIAEGGLAFSIFQPLGYKDKTFQAT